MIFENKMIYLENTTEAQAVYVPRDTDLRGVLRLTMRSTVGLDVPVDVVLLDLDVHRLCYHIGVTLPDGIASGEYEYRLTADGETVSTGIMVVKDGLAAPGQYNKTIQYEQYEG